jgi:hypothetical protein
MNGKEAAKIARKIPKPSAEEIEKYLKGWENNKKLNNADKVIKDIFNKFN